MSLLSRLDDGEISALVAVSEKIALRAGAWLFREGDTGDALYVVLSGRLQVVANAPTRAEGDDSGREIVVRSLGFGDAVGELAVLCAAPRSASVRAVRDSTLMRVSQADVAELCHADPSFAVALLETVGEKLRTRDAASSSRVGARVLAVVALDPAAPVRELGAALAEAIEGSGRVASITPDAVSGGEAEWCAALDHSERDHDFVVLVGSETDPAGEWSEFCTRQADRVLGVVGAPARAVMTRHETWDLVLCGAASERWVLRHWLDLVRPRAWHQVRDGQQSVDVERLARRVIGTSVGAVLSGGGARGFAHLGALAELVDAGIRIDRVGGTSMGAFVSALFAIGCSPAELARVCRTELVDRRPFRDFTWPRTALIRAQKAQAMLERLFGTAHLDDLVTDCFCVSADLTAAEVVVHRRGAIFEAVGASMSLAGPRASGPEWWSAARRRRRAEQRAGRRDGRRGRRSGDRRRRHDPRATRPQAGRPAVDHRDARPSHGDREPCSGRLTPRGC